MDTLEHFYHNQHIYIRHEETNEIKIVYLSFGFLSFFVAPQKSGVHSVSCVPFLARLSLFQQQIETSSCGLQRMSLNHFSYSAKKKKKDASISVTPPTLTMQ